ncbi:hypothetical protein NW755_014207 [Fusarium falciforme]|uniref:FAD-binding domain-containing protein n=1 Tax=Fusarium falciforme TaxID=195108 RepID=A0A9W8US62_9HYPO|nr:hypothetical protein NW755_014207 [Fusarium falciforme]KAJ4241708.1 hypothetical protein NW757_012048 [Fusarium falciforme]
MTKVPVACGRASASSAEPPATIPVVIVGGGPAGLFSAYLLGRQNIPSIIITRYQTRLGQPKAHAINPRTLEIFRQAGLDVGALRELSAPLKDAFWVRFNLGLADHELGKLPYERQDEAASDVTPEPLFNISQPIMEEFLQEAALSTGSVTIHASWNWLRLEFVAGKPVSILQSRSEPLKVIRIKSEYIIGADGTESTVRAAMANVKWASPDDIERPKRFYCSIHASGDLTRSYRGRDRRGQLSFCFHPNHRAGLIIYHPVHSWVHARVIDPTQEPKDSFTEARCKELIQPCVGPDVDIKIHSVNMWYTWARVATDYSDTTHRIHLVGDAAHSFPPQGGLGINTGIADVHNLIWKLGALLRSKADSIKPLLATYTQDRRPVAIANSVQSAHNEDIWAKFNMRVNSAVTKVLENGSSFDEPTLKQHFDQELALNKQHFDSLALQIGYVYDPALDPTQMRTDCGNYQPSSTVGARVPHAWLQDGRSTLDLVPDNGFVIFHSGSSYVDSIYEFGSIEIPMKVVDMSSVGAPESWLSIMGLGSDKAVVVRPDQHVLGHVTRGEDAQALVARYLQGQ